MKKGLLAYTEKSTNISTRGTHFLGKVVFFGRYFRTVGGRYSVAEMH